MFDFNMIFYVWRPLCYLMQFIIIHIVISAEQACVGHTVLEMSLNHVYYAYIIYTMAVHYMTKDHIYQKR